MSSDDWSPAIGLRRAAVYLLACSIVVGAIWGLLVYLAAPAMNAMGPRLIFLIPSVAFGMAMGWVMSRDLQERAGFSGWLVIAMGVLFAIATLLGAMYVVDVFRPLKSGSFTLSAGRHAPAQAWSSR